MSTSVFWTETTIELPGVREGGMSGRKWQRKPGTTRGSPRRSRTAKASRISRRAVKSRCAHERDGWGRLSDDGPGHYNPDLSEGPWGGGVMILQGGAQSSLRPDTVRDNRCDYEAHEGRMQTGRRTAHAGSRLKPPIIGKAPLGKPAFQPYWGKPAVRNDRGDRGNVGIIRSPVRASILPDIRHRRLSHRKAELEQLFMDAQRTPKQIFSAHPTDQGPQIPADLRSAAQVPRFPTPVAAKSGTMPAHQGLWPNDLDRLEDRRKPTIQLDEEQAIVVGEPDPTAHLALQHSQLLPERGILCFKSALGLEERGNQPQQQEYQGGHRGRRQAILLGNHTDKVFGTHKGRMHLKTHDKACSVVMEDGSEWKIWPADIAATLQWEPSSDLIQEIDDEPCTHAIVDRAHGTCVRVFEAAEDWVPEQMDAWLVS